MTDVFSPGRYRLGEGPLWDARTRTLYWVDIVAGEILSRTEGDDAPHVLRLGVQVGCLGLTEDPGVLVAGLRDGWHLVEVRTGRRRLLADPEADRPSCRFNDGGVDPTGRFWTGSLEDSESGPDGRLYRLDGDGTYRTADEGFHCSNGIDWSPDGRRMYFVDSRQHRIHAYRFDLADGSIGEREVFADTTGLDGVPDGLRVDAAGDVWCAFWDGAHLTRFAPDGSVRESVALPVLRPTSVAFGGPGLRTMYITSASHGLTDDQLRQWPLSGAVLRREATTPGLPGHVFTTALTIEETEEAGDQ
ncbi:SMP-30/gluconolactonase/LRE family protein [Streptomyces sp. NBC_00669]|uniref:SMP-30/gluconolactonase/LRE family protein n=1 Tax=unclassified Streptomyces TaxID=2593676 RepID=UPI002E375BAB|nr:SMP-30/gluconolactonase/LRE family protein [Streptomyces sp. NBC_00669]